MSELRGMECTVLRELSAVYNTQPCTGLNSTGQKDQYMWYIYPISSNISHSCDHGDEG